MSPVSRSLAELASGMGVEEPHPREVAIRERLEWAREWGGGDVALFSAPEVALLVATIDGLRKPPPALVSERDDGWRRIGPDFDAWAEGEFFGRHLLLPDGTMLKLHVCVSRPYEWFVALPAAPDDLKRCLLEVAEHEHIDLAPKLSLGAAARLILEKLKQQVRYMEPEAVKALERLAEAP